MGDGQGGLGGGGNGGAGNNGGASNNLQAAADGQANRGGGGGGNGQPGGGDGGSGVVVLAYPSSLPAFSSIGGGLTYSVDTTTRAGYRVYTFTAGTGTVTP
jgi:hypothetical protein